MHVHFIYAYPLDSGRRVFAIKNEVPYPSREEVIEAISHWKQLWNKHEKAILALIATLTKQAPTRQLECFVFGGMLNPMSTPFLMPVLGKGGRMRDDESFLQTMIHEILHIFVGDNTHYFKFVRAQYKDESILTQNHIIIYTLLEKIYTELFESTAPDIKHGVSKAPDYQRAIDIVKKHGVVTLYQEYLDNSIKL